MIYMNGLGSPDSYGNEEPADGTSLPSSELLSSSWDSAGPPAPAPAGKPATRRRSYAHAPVSPSLLTDGGNAATQSLYPDGFPAPTKAPAETIFGIVPLPRWLPKWAVYGAGLAALAFAADYGYRRFVKGGRRVVTNPKERKRAKRVRLVEGDDGDLMERAAKFREEFHWGIPARKSRRAKVSKVPRVATKLGELVNVTYKTKKRGEKAQFFVHEFGEEGGRRPTLAMDIENKKLHIVGGDYDVTADGIKD